ncbi:transposase [Streptomyces sp. SID685]|uniref:IS701 family transposase n=1 Tax=Streptomyces sp. SID685 TaxID=2690322 RepID=UPI001F41F3F7|nr:transposase [Streptomyces sp. SID685]
MVNSFDLDAPGSSIDVDGLRIEESGLNDFCAQIFGHLLRVDQRRCACAYVSAILTTPGKKSIRRLARAVSASPAAAQSLRQFVNGSPWSWQPALHELASWTRRRGPVRAWSIGRAFLPKRGERSVGVHRHYDPFSNRTLNCQLGYGAFLSVGAAHIPVDWELSLPGVWSDDMQLRRRARIPDAEQGRPAWAHTLGLVDSLAARMEPAPVVADLSDEPDVGLLIQGLEQRGHDFVIAVPHRLRVHISDRLGGRRTGPAARYLASTDTSVEMVVPGAPGDGGGVTRILAVPVGLRDERHGCGSAEDPYRLFAKVGPGQLDQAWITNLRSCRLREAVKLAELSLGTSTAVSAMARWFGLLDFEGRSFPGWHHHMTLVSATYAYGRLGPLGDRSPNHGSCNTSDSAILAQCP